MTREEIIEGLKLLEDNMVHFDELQNDEGEWIDVHELLFEAIQALSQEPCDDAISREDAIGAIYKANDDGFLFDRVLNKIKALPSVTPKPIECEDAISREEVLEQAWTLEYPDSSIEEVVSVRDIEQLPPVTPSRHEHDCSTCIYQEERDSGECYECVKGIQDWYKREPSRRKGKDMTNDSAIRVLEREAYLKCEHDKEAYKMAISALKRERKGHWIIIDDCEKFIAKCSECGRIEDSRMISKYPYCHCGARMVEPQESEE